MGEYRKWTTDEESTLVAMREMGASSRLIGKALGRKCGNVNDKVRHMMKVGSYGCHAEWLATDDGMAFRAQVAERNGLADGDYEKAVVKWSRTDEMRLVAMQANHMTMDAMAAILGRKPDAVSAKLWRMHFDGSYDALLAEMLEEVRSR